MDDDSNRAELGVRRPRPWADPRLYNLLQLSGRSDGGYPRGGVTLDASGALYGTTYLGGVHPCVGADNLYFCGTVFKLTPVAGGSWSHTVIHNFNAADGAFPAANLLLGSDGALYGTAVNGGAGNNGGVAFRLTPPENGREAWSETVLFSFPGDCAGQRDPYGMLSMAPGGALIGSVYASRCNSSGAALGGAVFMLT